MDTDITSQLAATMASNPPPRSMWNSWWLLPLASATAGVIAVYAVAIYALGEDSAVRAFVTARGFTQPMTLLLAFWGFSLAVRRMWIQQVEYRALWSCRSLVNDGRLDHERVEPLRHALNSFAGTLSGDALTGIVSYFRGNRPTRDEVLKIASREMDRMSDRVADDYGPIQALLWLIPLSGFLGTVLGMSAAIGSFDNLVGAQTVQLSLLLPAVEGLATAFDTTLLALALVVPLKIIEVAVQRRDHTLLDRVDREVGTGLVQKLDLAGLAQQTPEEAAYDRYAETLDRIQLSLGQLDGLLEAITRRVGTVTQLEQSLTNLGEASRAVRDAVPAIRSDLEAMRQQSEQPLTLVRAGAGAGRERDDQRDAS